MLKVKGVFEGGEKYSSIVYRTPMKTIAWHYANLLQNYIGLCRK